MDSEASKERRQRNWWQGFPLRQHPDTSEIQTAPREEPFEFGEQAGSITLPLANHTWSLGFALPVEFLDLYLDQRSTGFQLIAEGTNRVTVVCPAPGILVGEAPFHAVPELFSTELNFHEEKNRCWLDFGDERILIQQEVDGHRRRFALMVSPLELDELVMFATEWLTKTDPLQLWESETERRRNWKLPHTGSNVPTALACQARELIDSCLRTDGALGPGLWCRDFTDGDFQLSSLLSTLPTLGQDDPPAALALIETLRALQRDDGFLPSRVTADGQPATAPAWPVFAQAFARMAEGMTGDTTALQETCLAIAQNHLQYLAGTILDGAGIPCWPEADEAFTPDIMSDDGRYADLPLLMLGEIDAIVRLGGSEQEFAGLKASLATLVRETFYQKSFSKVMDLQADGSPVKRSTASSVLPLISEELQDDLHPEVYKQLRGGRGTLNDYGILQWEHWDKDPAPPPIRSELQTLILPVILRRSPTDIRTLVTGSLVRALSQLFSAKHGLAGEWSEEKQGLVSDHQWSLHTASLCLQVASIRTAVDLSLHDYPPVVRFLERYRKQVVGGVVALGAACVLALALYYAMLPSFTAREQYTHSGTADTMYSLGEYEKARDGYLEIIDRVRDKRFLTTYYFKLGKTEYRLENYEGALRHFEQAVALDKDRNIPNALWNLAQLQRQQGLTDDAVENFQLFLDQYGESFPELSKRAKLAIRLIQNPHQTLQEQIKRDKKS